MIPIILKPKINAVKNRWRHSQNLGRQLVQDTLIGFFSLLLIGLVFLGTSDALNKIREFSEIAYLAAAHPLGLILMALFAMLMISNLVIALGTLFGSFDHDLLLSAPLGVPRLFAGKFVHILITSSWMPVLLMLPFLIAFGEAYDAPLEYYLFAPLLLLPYFAIPTGLAISLATLFTVLVPPQRTKEVLGLCVLCLLAGLYMLLDLIDFSGSKLTRTSEVFRLISLLSMPNLDWIPSNWVARCLGELLEPQGQNMLPEFLLLFACAGAATALSYVIFDLFQLSAHSNAGNNSGSPASSKLRLRLQRLAPSLKKRMRAIYCKEYLLIVRDITQAAQLLLLLGLCILYLYNLRIFRTVDTLPDQALFTWKRFLHAANIAMGAFITTAICTRFVFPSISLEGRSYWMLISSPLRVRDLLRVKFYFWFFPIAMVSSAFFAAGALTLNAPMAQVFFTTICAWVICYGIVGLGIGCGAYFANFDWEYSAQLAASFGSFVYMLMSILLILSCLLPSIVLMWTFEYHVLSELAWGWGGKGVILLVTLLLCYLNYLIAKLALLLGEYSLLKRQE